MSVTSPLAHRARRAKKTLLALDSALFTRVARAHTPWLDRAVPALSRSANHSILWMAVAAGLTAGGSRRGMRAAVRGLASIGATSLLVNQGAKRVFRRPRPSLRYVPAVRRVKVAPLTTSFPSGHAASAAAFTAGAAAELAPIAPPLAVVAGAVGVSRVYVGVHYPLDVLVGFAAGATVARLGCRIWPVLPARADDTPPSDDRRHVDADPDGRGVVVVVNPKSGSAEDGLEACVRERLPHARIVQLEPDAELDDVLAQAAADHAVLGIAGGDGSIAAAAKVALERSGRLLALPGGTLNHLARDLRVDDVGDALGAVISGETVRVDVATIDGEAFLNSAGFGAYAQMLENRERLEPRLGRWLGQLAAFAATVVHAKPLEVTVNGERQAVWTAFVGNCRYEPSGLGPSWRPRLDDGRLDVRILRADLPRSRARLALAMLSGRLARSSAYVELSVSELRVETSRPRLQVARDGDPCETDGRFVVRKRPRALEVYAPHRSVDG
jgi:diacylglycerol kinase family enzyme/membrane-associated phospholipid phosphatase